MKLHECLRRYFFGLDTPYGNVRPLQFIEKKDFTAKGQKSMVSKFLKVMNNVKTMLGRIPETPDDLQNILLTKDIRNYSIFTLYTELLKEKNKD